VRYLFCELSYCQLWILIALTLLFNICDVQHGSTALHRACYDGHMSVVQYLINIGTDVNLSNNVSMCYC